MNGHRHRFLRPEDLAWRAFRSGIRAIVEDRPEWTVCGEAATGAGALQETTALRPNLLLLDLSMPDMDETMAIPQIIKVCPTVRIIALATEDSRELALNALATGAHGLALTSESARDLLLTVESVGQGQPFLSPAAVNLTLRQVSKPDRSKLEAADLTPREIEVFELFARGHSNKDVAAMLTISMRTVNEHRGSVMRKLRLHSYGELIHFAILQGSFMVN